MALKKCKECGKEVSTNAKTCPHCGVKNPGVSAKDMIIGLLGLIFIGWLVTHCSTDENDPKEAQKAKIDDATCKLDLQCWGDKHNISAGVYCDDSVEKLAQYSARWTDGTFETKFSHFRWLNKEKGTLTFIGDKIEFQNGFGAYQTHVYECDFDPASNTVLDVRAFPGRL
jgi:hypothetical protein